MGNSVQKDFADYTQAFFGGPTKKGVRYNQAKVGQTPAKVGKSTGEPQPRRGKAVPLPRSDNFTYAERAQRVVVYGEPIDGPAARKKAERKIKTQMKNDPKPKNATVSTKKTPPPAGKFDEKVMPKSSELAERVKKAQERTDRIDKALPVQKKSLWTNSFQTRIKSQQRQLLFLNPGDEKIRMAQYSILNKLELPKWAWPFRKQLAANQKSLYFYPPAAKKALKVGLREEKRTAIRNTYFNPAEPSTIQPITDKLRDQFANLPKKEVRNTLMTFPTYQKNFGRRLPPKVLGKMVLTQPGILACDMFFPSPKLGWKKINCLTIMDCWSRFTRCYAMDRKNYESTEKAMATFCKEFAALGHLPRRMLCDKGSELRPAYKIMELYRMKRDGKAQMVFHSQTGTPVNIVEAMNAQIQRRLQVFRTARLTSDVPDIIEAVCDQINSQRRPDRGNLTPLQLLTLSPEERKRLNATYQDRAITPEVLGLPELFVGSTVRALRMTRKDQVTGKIKGFAPKWSTTVYRVSKKLPIAKNNDHYRYYLEGSPAFFYRHELLKIPRRIDDTVPSRYVKQLKVGRGDRATKYNIVDDEYNPEDDEDYGSD